MSFSMQWLYAYLSIKMLPPIDSYFVTLHISVSLHFLPMIVSFLDVPNFRCDFNIFPLSIKTYMDMLIVLKNFRKNASRN